jgi:hypothetical protein
VSVSGPLTAANETAHRGMRGALDVAGSGRRFLQATEMRSLTRETRAVLLDVAHEGCRQSLCCKPVDISAGYDPWRFHGQSRLANLRIARGALWQGVCVTAA